jgi:hypothetical protein
MIVISNFQLQITVTTRERLNEVEILHDHDQLQLQPVTSGGSTFLVLLGGQLLVEMIDK